MSVRRRPADAEGVYARLLAVRGDPWWSLNRYRVLSGRRPLAVVEGEPLRDVGVYELEPHERPRGLDLHEHVDVWPDDTARAI